MLTIRELIKTLHNALNQKLKKHRGNWDQNDPSANDYIKNRPFYTDSDTIVIKEKTFTTYDNYEWCSPFVLELKENETYKIIWDGKEYVCLPYVDGDGICLGNLSFDGGSLNTGEPFFYFYWEEEGYNAEYGFCVQKSGTHTVSVYKQNVKKIDKKYIPDNEQVEMALSNIGNYIAKMPVDVVRYDTAQGLTVDQKTQARNNIGAISINDLSEVAIDGDYNDLKNKPCSEITTYSAWLQFSGRSSWPDTYAPTGNTFSHLSSDGYFNAGDGILAWQFKKIPQLGGGIYLQTDYAPAKVIDGTYYWGNPSLYNSSYEDTGESWCIYSDTFGSGYYVDVYFYCRDNIALTVFASVQFITLSQLPDKFIPNTIARASDVIPTPSTAQIGQTIAVKSVDDAGKPTEWEATRLLKSINGTEPDENGDFALIENKTWQVVEMSSMPGMLNAYGVDAAEVSSYLRNNVHNHSTFYRIIMKTDDSIETRPHTHVVTISQDDGTNDVIIYHGDDLAPIIVDVSENTFTLDPDWVAPVEPVIIPDTTEADMHLTTDMDGNKVWVKNADYVTADEVNGLISEALSKFVNAEEVSY